MRLICPRCGAQYEIDAAAIPAAGRDVECSTCDHIWRARPEGEAFDPAARPRLSRPLSESVIEILRQEAARELEVRAAERRSQRLGEAGLADHSIAEAVEPAPGAPGPVPATASADDTLLPGDAPEPKPRAGAAVPAATPAATVAPAAAAPASAPAVKVSGVTYSSNAAHRMLIANGKVVREGEEIEPGLKVEVISPRSAILNHRGSRYNINY